MPRRLKLDTREMGFLDLYLIYDEDGVWEEEWRELQGEWYAPLLTTTSSEVLDQALKGYTQPLVKALGLSPQNCLIKIPEPARKCGARENCLFFDRGRCFPTAKKMPWCFVPDGIEGAERNRLAAEVIRLWREGVYVVLVT
jgi:hypothetical protein